MIKYTCPYCLENVLATPRTKSGQVYLDCPIKSCAKSGRAETIIRGKDVEIVGVHRMGVAPGTRSKRPGAVKMLLYVPAGMTRAKAQEMLDKRR